MSDSEDDNPARKAGRFEKGKSGNLKGRPRLSEKISHPETFRDRVFAIAEFKIPTSLSGKRRKLTLYEVNVLNLGLKGAEGDARASEKFLDKVHENLEQELRYMREALKNLQSVEPLWLKEEDPVRRAALKQQWDYALNAATGRRERTTSHFPAPKRKPRR